MTPKRKTEAAKPGAIVRLPPFGFGAHIPVAPTKAQVAKLTAQLMSQAHKKEAEPGAVRIVFTDDPEL